MGFFKKIKKAIGGVAKMSLGLAGGLLGGLNRPEAPDAAPAPAAAAAPSPDAAIATREQDMRRAQLAAGSDYSNVLGSDAEEMDAEGRPRKRLRAAREMLG